MTEGTRIVAEQVAERVWQQNSTKDAVAAVMYLRSLVGTEYDQTFHEIMRRIGENKKKGSLPDIE